jgi:hypothetical protein
MVLRNVGTYHATTRRHNPEDLDLNLRRGNLKSRMKNRKCAAEGVVIY